MEMILQTLGNLLHQTAFFNITWGNFVMIGVAFVFLYLAIKHGFEPLLLPLGRDRSCQDDCCKGHICRTLFYSTIRSRVLL